MKLSVKFIHIFLLFLAIDVILSQSMFDDLIEGALKLVKPIIETAKPIVEDIGRSAQKDNAENPLRDENILGIHPLANKNVPICKGNSRICQFISCSAHNFKYDSNFANLNLVAQLMGDKKMRKALSSNPETVTEVCQEQGLSETECKLFARGFSLMDNFITNLEGNEETFNNVTKHSTSNKNENLITSHPRLFDVPSRPVQDKEEYDMDLDDSQNIGDDYVNYQSSLPRTGSRNWSSKQKIVPLPRPTTSPIKPISTTHLKIKSISFGEQVPGKLSVPRAQLPSAKPGMVPIVPMNQPRVARRQVAKKPPVKKQTPTKVAPKRRNVKIVPIRVQPNKRNAAQVRNKNNNNRNQRRVPKSIDRDTLINNFVINLNNEMKQGRVKRSSDYYDELSSTSKKDNSFNNSENHKVDAIFYDDSQVDDYKKVPEDGATNNSSTLKQNCLQFLG
uniref:CPG4 domain-containing protein n=1 Tax=Strongyloides papillosus TaxID=174720 RepID=A0A0N5C126_STREA